MANPQFGIVVFENASRTTAMAQAKFASLDAAYASYRAHQGTSKPSLPDYVALTSGQFSGKGSFGGSPAGADAAVIAFAGSQANLMSQLASAGFSWKTYEEGVAVDGFNFWSTASSPNYATSKTLTRHCPAAFYTATKAGGVSHGNGRYDFTELASDITGNSLPDFFIVTPNAVNDGHDSGVGPANTWITSGGSWSGIDNLIAAMRPGGLLAITFDNVPVADTSPPITGTGIVYLVIAGPGVAHSTTSTASTHFSLLKAIQALFGVAPFSTGVDSNYTSAAALTLPGGSSPPPPGASIDDVYSRAVSNGWGTSSDGHTWTQLQGDATQLSVTSGTGGQVAQAATKAPVIFASDISQQDYDVTVTYKFSAVPTGGTQNITVAVRGVDAANYTRFTIDQSVGGHAQLGIDRQIANANTSLGTFDTGAPQAANTVYKARLQAIGTSVKARVWLASTTEPSTWQISGTDNVASIVAGSPGVRLQATSGWTGGAVYTISEFKGAVATGGGGGGGSGGIQFRTATDSANGTTSTSVTPASAVAGDLMLAHVSAVGASTITAPAGWNQVATVNDSTAVATAVFSKTASSSEASATFSCAGAAGMRTVISYVTGGASVRTVKTNGSSGTAVVNQAGSALTGLSIGDEVCTFLTSNCGPRPWGDTGCVFGLMPNPTDWSTQAAIAAVETTVSRKLSCAHSMVPWDCHVGATNGDFTSNSLAPTVDYNNNRLTYSSWPRPRPGANASESSWQSVFGATDPATTMGQIAAGTFDSIIDNNATAYKTWGQTTGGVLIIRLFWEMNGGGVIFDCGKSASVNTYQTNFLAAWQRIVTRTRAIAANVLFHWNPQNFQTTTISRDQLYPGDAYVDLCGTEAYLSPGDTFPSLMTNTSSNGHTYQAIYAGYSLGSSHNLIGASGESGCRLQAGEADSATLARVQSYESGCPTFPGWKLLVWWNGNGTNGDSTIADQGTQTKAEIAKMIASSYFTPDLQSSWKPVAQAQVYESRRALGAAAKTNYGAGQVAATLAHTTQAAAGASTALAASTWGYGKYGAITLALATGSSDTQPPTAPGSVTASATTPSSIKITWTASTDNVGVTGYKVWETTGTRTAIQTLSGATLSFTVTSLAASSTHSYVVTASDAAGNTSSDSNTATATTPGAPDTTRPTAPGALTATATATTINLSWTASTDNVGVTGYTVIRDGLAIATIPPGTTFTDSTGTPGTVYTYTVTASDGAGNASVASNSAAATYPTPPVNGLAIRSQHTYDVVGATSVTFAPPPGTAPGDVVIAVLRATCAAQTLGLVQMSPGWAAQGAVNSAIVQTLGWVAYNTNQLSYTWTWTNPVTGRLSVLAVTGTDTVNVFDGGGNFSSPSSSPFVVPHSSVTLADGGDMMLLFGWSSQPVAGTAGPTAADVEAPATVAPGLAIFTASLSGVPSGLISPVPTNLTGQVDSTRWDSVYLRAGTPVITNTPPLLSVSSPVDGQTLTATSVTVQAQTSDPDGISAVKVSVNSGAFVAMNALAVDAAGNGTYGLTVTLTTSASPGTANTIQVQSTDNAAANNATATAPTITVNAITPSSDSTGPTFTWSQPPSGNNLTIQGATGFDFTITGIATDASGVNNIQITNPDSTVSTIGVDQNGNFSYDWNLATGANAFTVVATDSSPAANTTTKSFTLTLANPDVTDTTGPTLAVTSPAANQTVHGAAGTQYNVTGTAVDPSGIASVTVNSLAVAVDASSGDFSTTITLASGANTVTVVATDASAGSNTTTIAHTITLAAVTGPTLTVTAPVDGLTVTGDSPYLYEVTGTVTSPVGIGVVTVNGMAAPVASDGSWSILADLSPGPNTLTVTATDTQAPVAGQTTIVRTVTLQTPQAGFGNAFNLSSDQARIAERIQERGLE